MKKIRIVSAVDLEADALPEHCFIKKGEEGSASLFYDDGKTKGEIVLQSTWFLMESDDEGEYLENTPLNKKVPGLETRLNARIDEYHEFGHLIEPEKEPEDYPEDHFRDDVEADADTLASAGFGTDEDYGYYGEE